MRKIIFLPFFLLFSFLFIFVSGNNYTTIKIENANITGVGNFTVSNVTADIFPNGLSGYNITVSINNSSIAEIESIKFPSWATLHINSSLPSSSVWIKAVDLYKKVEKNAANITLVTLNIKGKQEGEAFINISITKIDDDNGNTIPVITKNATIMVRGINHPPSTPILNAPSSGYIGNAITFSVKSTDKDGDKIRYGFDWNNDDIVDEWTEYYNSGSRAIVTHIWNNAGTYTIKVIAEDEHGMKSQWSNAVTITINRYIPSSSNKRPSVEIIYPLNDSTLNDVVTIKGKASDDKKVVKVEIKIDNGEWDLANGTNSWSYEWNTSLFKNGKHIIYARAYDGSLYSNIASVQVNVFNDHKPDIIIISPLNNQVVKGKITIKGKASDMDGNETIQKVEVSIDNGAWHVVNGTVSWNYSLNTKELKNGIHIIKARCYDGIKYSDIASIQIKVRNEKVPGFGFIAMLIGLLAATWLWRKK